MSEEYINPEAVADILTFEEVSKILRVSVNTVRRMTKRAENPLPVINLSTNKRHMPRIRKEDLQRWLDSIPNREI